MLAGMNKMATGGQKIDLEIHPKQVPNSEWYISCAATSAFEMAVFSSPPAGAISSYAMQHWKHQLGKLVGSTNRRTQPSRSVVGCVGLTACSLTITTTLVLFNHQPLASTTPRMAELLAYPLNAII